MPILAGIATAVLGNVVKASIAKAVTKVADDKTMPEIKKADAAQVTDAVIDVLAKDKAFINATNSERWYQSGVAWGFNGVTAGALTIFMPEVFTHGYHLADYNWPVAGPAAFVLASAGFGYVRRFVPGLKPMFSKGE